MTVDQLVVHLGRYPAGDLVVMDGDRLTYVMAVAATRVHAAPNEAFGILERHAGTDCAGCARQIAIVSAVALVGRASGGGR